MVRVRGGEGKENVREWERKIKDVRIFSYSRAKEGEESCGDASLAEAVSYTHLTLPTTERV